MGIKIILHGTVKDGMDEAFADVGARAKAAADAEPGTLSYQWWTGPDSAFYMEEVYADEAGFFAHVGAATEAGIIDDLLAAVDLGGVLALDPVNDEMREALAGWGTAHYEPISG